MPPRPEELEPGRQLTGGGNGILFVGEKGKIMCPGWGGNPRIIPEPKMKEYKRPAKTLPRSNGHHRDWLDACKGGPPASGNFQYGARLTEITEDGPRLRDWLSGVDRNRQEINTFLVTVPYRNGSEVHVRLGKLLAYLSTKCAPGWSRSDHLSLGRGFAPMRR